MTFRDLLLCLVMVHGGVAGSRILLISNMEPSHIGELHAVGEALIDSGHEGETEYFYELWHFWLAGWRTIKNMQHRQQFSLTYHRFRLHTDRHPSTIGIKIC